MQIQDVRGGGFIVSPLSTVNTAKKIPKKSGEKNRYITKSHISSIKNIIFEELYRYSKAVLSTAISLSIVVCSVMVFCKLFTFGIVIYNANGPIAYAYSETDYQKALSEAENYAQSQNIADFKTDFKITPTVTFRKGINKGTTLRDKLLLGSSEFAASCTLYSGNTPVYNAESREIAEKAVKDYIESFSVNGNSTVETNLTYKESILPKSMISCEDECRMLLLQSDSVPVISVVNSDAEKEIPYETKMQNDSTLYIGETVTVTEGKAGSSKVTSQTVYKNGTPESNKILSENIVITPVTKVVRVGTKPKDVLSAGLFYPLTGVLSSPFGERWGRNHEGIDIAVPVGTSVKAAECGTVVFAGNGGSYGNLVKIDHGNGVVTAYAHLDKINVSTGQTVNADTEIALSGNTGRSTGPHLHFEVVKDGTPLNPDKYLKKR